MSGHVSTRSTPFLTFLAQIHADGIFIHSFILTSICQLRAEHCECSSEKQTRPGLSVTGEGKCLPTREVLLCPAGLFGKCGSVFDSQHE